METGSEITLFVSHHSSKLDVAELVEKALAKRGVKCWIAPRDVDPGEPFDKAVRDAIEGCTAVLLLFCAQSDKSRHVKRELILADSSGHPIIPLRLEAVDPRDLAYHLADTQWIDWIERREAVIDRVATQARQYAVLSGNGDVPPPPARVPERAAFAPEPASRGGSGMNIWLIVLTVLALIVAAVAVTWLVATRGGQEPLLASSEPTAEAGSEGIAADGGEADEPDAPEPAPPEEPAPAPVVEPPPVRPSGLETSFNCGDSTRTAEFLICGSPTLAAQDREMALLYGRAQAAIRRAGGSGQQLRQDQRAWIGQIQTCNTEACISQLQQERIRYLRQRLTEGA
ncbi:TIR domain-containing protein [Parasphingopyxis marina]|uniref:TIR domain-containing protein n=1 Tax=Parasphingopyxis marina TaxID=2761622 RepID=A0A842I3U2_9SPHN|nr:TIR domain-containing protein [Parasphingopyxis marina]MBC2778744.1 TIR domain-containing protein [Parasphingopyxis marina]